MLAPLARARDRVRPLLALVLVVGSVVWFTSVRFQPRTVSAVAPDVQRAPLTARVALVVLDGVREDRFRALFGELAGIASRRGTLCSVEGPRLSFTLAGVYGLGTGDLATIAELPENFESRPTRVDSLPAAVARGGKRVSFAGERLWSDLFGAFAAFDDTARDRGPYEAHAPEALSALERNLRERRCELCVLHDAELDGLAHRHTLFGDAYESYARRLSARLADLVTRSGEDVTWLITSDHGMLDTGNHGGAEPQNRSSFLAAFGPGIRSETCTETLEQADIPTSAAVLLGVPIPWHSRGKVADVLAGPRDRGALDRELFEQKHRLAAALIERYEPGSPVPASLEACRRTIERITGGADPLRLAATLLPVVLALALLGLRRLELLAWLLFGWVFANRVYPHTSYELAAILCLGAAAVALFAAALTRSPAWMLWVGLGALLSTESHFVAQLSPVLVGGLVFAALRGVGPIARWAASLSAGVVLLFVIEAAWAFGLSTRALDAPSGAVTLVAACVAGVFGALAVSRSFRLGIDRRHGTPFSAGYLFAATFLLGKLAPPTGRLSMPLIAGALCGTESRWMRTLSAQDAVAAALLVLAAVQMNPATFVLLLVIVTFACACLSAGAIDDALGPAARWARGAGLLGCGYIFAVAEGNRFAFSDINVLAGFVGGAIGLHLPVTAALIALYYASPLVITLALWARMSGATRAPRETAQAAAALAVARLLYLCGNFVWGELAEGSWDKQLGEAALLVTWAAVLLLALAVGPAPREAEGGAG